MSKVQKTIAWEKFSPQEDEQFKDDASKIEEISDDDDENDDVMMQSIMSSSDFISLDDKVQTPFGFYQKDYPFNPYNMFDCWIGHTNFRITKAHVLTLETKIDGVGCLKILSPYRFFIGIEKLFDFAQVRTEIQNSLY